MIFNQENLSSLVGNDDAIGRRYCETFMDQVREVLPEIAQMAQAEQLSDAYQRAHYLKTSAKAVGAEEMVEHLVQFEDLCKQEKLDSCIELVGKINQAFVAFNQAVRRTYAG